MASDPPVVTSVSPSHLSVGGQFTINGSGFYPDQVERVQIGGTTLVDFNANDMQGRQITATASVAGDMMQVMVITANGWSNGNVCITVSS